jgi:hypothetical protein
LLCTVFLLETVFGPSSATLSVKTINRFMEHPL